VRMFVPSNKTRREHPALLSEEGFLSGEGSIILLIEILLQIVNRIGEE